MHVFRVIGLIVLVLAGFGCGGAPVGTPVTPTGSHIYVVDGGNNRIVRFDDMTGLNWTPFGATGAGIGQFNDPTDIAFDSLNRIYIADYANDRIVRMNDMTGAGWTTFGFSGTGTNQFTNPYKIAIDAQDRIYIVDSGNNRIVRIDDMTGLNWVTLGSLGSGIEEFNVPIGIALDSTGRIYVADFANHRIARFSDMTGLSWSTFGASGAGVGQFVSTVEIVLDSANHMLVVDRNGRVIQTGLMSSTGWTELATSLPQSVAINPLILNQLYVVDQNNHQLTRYDSIAGGNPVQFGGLGSGVNQFDNPTSVSIGP